MLSVISHPSRPSVVTVYQCKGNDRDAAFAMLVGAHDPFATRATLSVTAAAARIRLATR